jgi:hypothetical protein
VNFKENKILKSELEAFSRKIVSFFSTNFISMHNNW